MGTFLSSVLSESYFPFFVRDKQLFLTIVQIKLLGDVVITMFKLFLYSFASSQWLQA